MGREAGGVRTQTDHTVSWDGSSLASCLEFVDKDRAYDEPVEVLDKYLLLKTSTGETRFGEVEALARFCVEHGIDLAGAFRANLFEAVRLFSRWGGRGRVITPGEIAEEVALVHGLRVDVRERYPTFDGTRVSWLVLCSLGMRTFVVERRELELPSLRVTSTPVPLGT